MSDDVGVVVDDDVVVEGGDGVAKVVANVLGK